MANLERGAYEPRTDNIGSFELDEEDTDGDEGARLPLLIAVALVVLAAFAGVVWLAYTQGVERGRAAAPQVVARNAVRRTHTAPVPPPFTGLNIYQTAGPTNVGPRGAGAAGKPHIAGALPALRPSANGGPERFATGSETPHPFAVAPPRPAPAPASTSARPAPPKVPTLAAVSAGASPTAASPVSQASGVLLQIGSYKSEDEAQQSWLAFKAKHPAATGYRSDVQHVDLGAKGNWYRLRMGGFSDKKSATEVCERLRADGASCLIAR